MRESRIEFYVEWYKKLHPLASSYELLRIENFLKEISPQIREALDVGSPEWKEYIEKRENKQ